MISEVTEKTSLFMLSSTANRGLKTIVGNGKLLRSFRHEIEENGAVVFDNDTIIDTGKTEEMRKKYYGSRYINADGKLIMPGLINAHGHYYGFYSRGMALKDALYLLESKGLKVHVQGKGRVVSQSIRAGARIREGNYVSITLRP